MHMGPRGIKEIVPGNGLVAGVLPIDSLTAIEPVDAAPLSSRLVLPRSGRRPRGGIAHGTAMACRGLFPAPARYRMAPTIQGLNSSSPTPAISLLLCSPEATAKILMKISSPSSSSVMPSRTRPALMSISGSWLA